MEQIVNTLLSRLTNKGLGPQEILWLIRDVLNIVKDGGEFTVEAINQKLLTLGWSEQIMDQSTFELITYFLENEGRYQVEKYNLH